MLAAKTAAAGAAAATTTTTIAIGHEFDFLLKTFQRDNVHDLAVLTHS